MSMYRSPFEQLQAKFENSDHECSQCGYTDTKGGWRATTSGSRVQYQFVCRSCGAVETKELRL